MPCLTSESFMMSVEKLSRDMCSTPISIDDGVCDNTSSLSELSTSETFDDCYTTILWELQKLESTRIAREQCIQRFLSLLCNVSSVPDDSKFH